MTKMLGRQRILCLVALLLVGVGLLTFQTRTAHAASLQYVNHCGYVSCSLYFTRSSTREIVADGAFSPDEVFALANDVDDPYVKAVLITVGVALQGANPYILQKASEAVSKNQCLRVRYGAPFITALYSDGSRYCHD